MFRWTIAGEVFWSMSFDWGLASETRENGGFLARKAAALTGSGFFLT